MNTLKAGNLAPQFTLLNKNELPVSLSQFVGKKVLVYFYPKALTPGCTTQACALRDIEKKELNFTLLSDPEHQVAEAFGVWGEKKFMGKTYNGIHRISFLINEQGVIEKVFDKFKTSEHHQMVIDYLKGENYGA